MPSAPLKTPPSKGRHATDDPPPSAWEEEWNAIHRQHRQDRRDRPMIPALWRGLRQRCPRCGASDILRPPNEDPRADLDTGAGTPPTTPGQRAGAETAHMPPKRGIARRLWQRFLGTSLTLQPRQACPCCGESFGQIQTDDFAPWLSILLLGHLLLPPIITVERLWHPPLWIQAVIWLPIAIELIRVVLPAAKGTALALMWVLGLRGDEQS